MCFAHPKTFEEEFEEELDSLDWVEYVEPEPTEEELHLECLEYQRRTYIELHSLVEMAGGELIMTQYSRFLLDELYLGPFWAHLGLDLIYEE